MAFVDQVKIFVKAGKGGDGAVSFRHEKYINMGGTFGGDGGHGGSVVMEVDEGLRTLMDFRYKRHFKATPGGNGATKGMTGKSADDLIIKVPQGTTITDAETGRVIGDLTEQGQRLVVAHVDVVDAVTCVSLHQQTLLLKLLKTVSQEKSWTLPLN